MPVLFSSLEFKFNQIMSMCLFSHYFFLYLSKLFRIIFFYFSICLFCISIICHRLHSYVYLYIYNRYMYIDLYVQFSLTYIFSSCLFFHFVMKRFRFQCLYFLLEYIFSFRSPNLYFPLGPCAQSFKIFLSILVFNPSETDFSV